MRLWRRFWISRRKNGDEKKVRNALSGLFLSFLILSIWFCLFATWVNAEEENPTHDYIEQVSAEYGVCPELIEAMIEAESSWNPNALSKSGCVGLMQISPKWHKDRMKKLGVEFGDLVVPEKNILVGVDYLAELIEKYQDVAYALDVYNGNSKAKSNFENGIISKYAGKILTRSAELERERGK